MWKPLILACWKSGTQNVISNPDLPRPGDISASNRVRSGFEITQIADVGLLSFQSQFRFKSKLEEKSKYVALFNLRKTVSLTLELYVSRSVTLICGVLTCLRSKDA